MRGFDYRATAERATRLIKRYGQTGKVRWPGTPDGPKHDPTPGEPVDEAASFVVIDYTDREIDGARILSTDKKALIAPEGLTRAPGPEALLVEASGAVYKIVRVETLKPAETALLYTAQVRR